MVDDDDNNSIIISRLRNQKSDNSYEIWRNFIKFTNTIFVDIGVFKPNYVGDTWWDLIKSILKNEFNAEIIIHNKSNIVMYEIKFDSKSNYTQFLLRFS
jgi:hypothetical protein